MRILDLDGEAMRQHGVERQVFLAPLADNTAEFLRGDAKRPEWSPHAAIHVGEGWKERWALPRSASDPRYKEFDPETWRLWTPEPAKPTLFDGTDDDGLGTSG